MIIYTILVHNILNFNIQIKYVQYLLCFNLIDRIHLWNFVGQSFIDEYNKGRLVNIDSTISIPFGTIINGKYKVDRLMNRICFYINNTEINSIIIEDESKYNFINLVFVNNSSIEFKYGNHIFSIEIPQTTRLYVQLPNVTFFNVSDIKNHIEYYRYYYNFYKDSKSDDILIKSNDTIVFIDLLKFKLFIDFVNSSDYLYIFPNILNNEIISYYQSKFKLIPYKLPYDSNMSFLCNNGIIANKLHNHFIDDVQSFLTKSDLITRIFKVDIGEKISVHFFAILAKNIKVFKEISHDETKDLIITVPSIYKKQSAIFMRFVISNLSYDNQIKFGLEEDKLRKKYNLIASSLLQ